MTILTGTFNNGLAAVPGKLVVTLAGGTVKTTAPKAVLLPRSFEILCPTGSIPGSTNIEETETKLTSYLFEYFPRISTSPDVFDTNQLSPFPFYAVMPNITTVDIADLAPTGMVTDVLATGALRIAKIIAEDPVLASSIGGVNPRGAYNASTNYKRGDMVSYLNRFFIASQPTPFSNVLPVDTSFWMEIPVQPSGNIAIGDSRTYGPVWDASGLAPTQDAVYDIIESLNSAIATKANANAPTIANINLTGNSIAPTVANGTNTNQIATTGFVQQLNRPAWNVFVTGEQNQSSDFYTILFNGENLDSNNAYSGGFFICPTGFSGHYLVGGGVYFVNLDSNPRVLGIELHVNGAAYRRLTEISLNPGSGIHCTLSTALLYLNAGQNCSLVVRTFGSTFNYRVAVTSTTWWGMRVAI